MLEAFHFDVGQGERHRVDFSFDKSWGRVKIRVDGFLVDHDHAMSVKLIRRYEFSVGQAERHFVAIEMERKLLLARFRKYSYRVFVDGQPVNVATG